MSESELQRKYERSQRRWGNLKSQIKSEIEVFSGFTGQKGAMYANRIAGLRWVLDLMAKSPDALNDAVRARLPQTVDDEDDSATW